MSVEACSGTNNGTTGTATGTPTGSPTGTTRGTTGSSGPATSSSGAASSTSAGSSSSTTSGSLGTTSGATGPYQAFDGGPHNSRRPNAGAADAGCNLAFPILTDAGTCTQCQSDGDCPAPTVCETSPDTGFNGLCVQCSATEPNCPNGSLCDVGNSDTCVQGCAADSACVTALGGYCNLDAGVGPIGCVLGCRTSADCPSTAPDCDPGSALCSPCDELAAPAGCATGQLCGYTVDGIPGCLPDCRFDAGICIPGLCDADAGSGAVQCLADQCGSDTDCAGSASPHCSMGICSQCASDGDCLALGTGTPICTFGYCGSDCSSDATGCGAQQCIFFDGGEVTSTTCVCTQDQDCAGQALAPSCLAVNPDAGLDAGAGLYGQCGCTLGSCAGGTICETRFDVLELVNVTAAGSACVPTCNGGGLSCADDNQQNTVCNPATGYCVACVDDGQCDADAGLPTCVAFDAGLPTGGGSCGCTPTACGNGDVCSSTYSLGVCQPACSYSADGFDSCVDGQGDPQSSLCNSETGQCQQCFEDADCTGQLGFSNTGNTFPLPFCSDAGSCYGCNTAADCPSTLPGCSQGVCGACATSADCTANNSCSPWGTCLPTCTVGGGQCSPDGGTPICSSSICVQCVVDTDCPVDGELCIQGICEFDE